MSANGAKVIGSNPTDLGRHNLFYCRFGMGKEFSFETCLYKMGFDLNKWSVLFRLGTELRPMTPQLVLTV